MKRVKCYGRKKYTLVETSAVRNFFQNYSPQTKNFAYENDSKEKEEIFSTWRNVVSPNPNKNNKCMKSSGKERKLSGKIESAFRKHKKYKGKRKCKRNIIQLCEKSTSIIDPKIPNWDSINKHSLILEYNFKKIEDFVCHASNKNILCNTSFADLGNSGIKESSHAEPQSPIPCAMSFQHEKNIFDSCSSNDFPSSYKVFSPVIASHSKLESMISHSMEFKILEIQKKNNLSKQNMQPVTSTPVFHHKKSHLMPINVSNLSAIGAKKKESNHKRELTFETSYSQISVPKKRNRSLNLNNRTSCSDKNSSIIQQAFYVSHKSYTYREKSIFLGSHSCLQQVSTENQESCLPKLLELCKQNEVIPFLNIYAWNEKSVRKVGEGSYGEVFMMTQNKKSLVLKVIPVSEDIGNNLQSIESVYSEIKVSQCLNELRFNKDFKTENFLLLHNVYVVRGSYPVELLKAWDEYSNTKTTYNYRPDTFDDQQIFTILELEYGGKDLSSFVLRNGMEAESVLKQITISLAIAEETHLFEHRDLHLGNILVQRVKNKNVSYILRGKSFSIPSEGVLVTIIDFTLSRILDGECIYYNDLAEDESLFNQSGDIQFEVYKATKFQLKNMWNECLLYSNVLWLNFICLKLQEHEYSRPSSIKHTRSMKNIAMLSEKLKHCKSAFDFFEACKIIAYVPEKLPLQETKLNSKRILIDRKSFQKTSLSKLK